MRTIKRKIDILVLSDIHLGTYGCNARELHHYLKQINPTIIVLNGDIIDIWQFSKRYWPKSHMKVVRQLFNWVAKGKKTYYITGNHDEMLRKFTGLKIGALQIVNKLVLDLKDGRKAWVFHGDVFDVVMQHSKWLARLGAVGYDSLILVNKLVNFISVRMLKQGKLSLSKRIKNSVKSAISFINNFEQTCADIGITNKFDFVICGHIHLPQMRVIANSEGSITYLNSGDWVENLSALEYVNGEWAVFRFNNTNRREMQLAANDDYEDTSNSRLFQDLVKEFNLK
jgi:UDP-2,3-diacylglucosamine pyrophosphatase LpxH